MGRNILVINVDIRETRVALIENGIIAELHLERESSKGTLGNIYLGKVSRVLPGMQAAFIDVGLERAAFLHVEDLIRPDDFEAYLQGHRRGSEEERETRSSDDEEAAAPAVEDRRPIDALREEDEDTPLVASLEASDGSAEPAAAEAYGDDAEDEERDAGDEGGEVDEAAFAPADGDAEDEGGDAEDAAEAGSEEAGDDASGDESASASDYDDRDAADAAADDRDTGDNADADADADVEDEEAADFASVEAASADFVSEPEVDAEPAAAGGDAERDGSDFQGDAPRAAAEDAFAAPEAEPSDAGLLMSDVFDGEVPEGEPFAEGTDGEPLPDVPDALAGDAALVAVPEGDSEIMVAQQRRRRGGRRDRVRRSRSTRDRLPEALAGATPAEPAAADPQAPPRDARPPREPQGAPREPRQPLADVRLARDQRPPPREQRQGPRDQRQGPRGQGGEPRGQQQNPTIRTHATTPDRPQQQGGGGGRGDRSRRDNRRDGRDDRRRGPAPQGGAPAQAQAPQAPGRRDNRRDGRRDNRSDNRDRGSAPPRTGVRGRNQEPPRISKTTPIREVVREGQEVLVQISKEPIGTKGARVTSHISLPGRYVVYLPTVDHVGISKRIGSEKERSRLREAIDTMKPPQGGLIVRTVAEGLTKKQLKADVGYLVRLWGEVVKKRETGQRAPSCLYSEVDLILKTARDLFTDDIEKIVIDSREEYFRLRKFIEMFMPERIDAIELYEGEEPIFDAYGIEDEIQRALARKVPLPSGGYLIIDQAEALTAIDVNTGRFVGKGSKDLEETILATNLEAVEEIAYQLRFRNIGGLIILDLIDMERMQNREKVRRRMEDLLAKDKAKTTLNRISELGLIEMTRKRTRESLGRTILEPCFYCDGTGQLQSKQTIAYEILRQIRRERMNLPGYVILVNAHPAIIDLLKNDERDAVTEAERIFQRRIDLVPRKEYHLEQFDLQGK